MWRNPQPKWTSPKGRVVQIGDSAHAFLPTSGSGATMALEDAFSLATCLELSGKANAPLGTKVHNILRYEPSIKSNRHGTLTDLENFIGSNEFLVPRKWV